MSPMASRSMWMTKRSPTALTGSASLLISEPEASIATWPFGLRSNSKISWGVARIGLLASIRSSVMGRVCQPSWAPLDPGSVDKHD